MADAKQKYTPLTRKVNAIIAASLVLGIGGIVSFFSLSIVNQIKDQTEQNLIQQSKLLSESIITVMPNGEAPLAVELFDRLEKESLGYAVKLFRVNGEPAFSDNTTIQAVNARQSFKVFQVRTANRPGLDTSKPVEPYFDQVITPSPVERTVSYELSRNGAEVFSVYQPLVNTARCWGCHGTDATIRGVIAIESDITQSLRDRQFYLAFSIGLFLFLVGALTVVLTQYLHRAVIRPVRLIGTVCTNVTSGVFKDRVDVKKRDEIGVLGETVNKMVTGLHERFELTKFVSSSTLQSVTGDKSGRRREMTIFFSDIRGFTSYSENRRPEEVVEVLNKILNFQTELIVKNNGDIDKYVGDEIVAIFTDETAELAACRTALAIQKELAQKSAVEYNGLSVGIGINIGEVILGMIGSEKRADFTIIGDNVNVASRFCNAAKAGQIIIAENLYRKVRPNVDAHGPYKIKVKGKADFIRVYVLEGMKE